ncbi:MAG: hypothetical protein J7L61_01080 [Thermoplasmata archaeon]|nr:hypothetical protein [Thermoplasmata archaeon]
MAGTNAGGEADAPTFSLSRKKTVVLLLAIVLIASSLLFISSFREPEVTEASISFLGFEGGNPVFLVELTMHNPNMVGGTLVGGEVNLYVEGMYVGVVSPSGETYVPPGSEAVVPLRFVLAHLPFVTGNPVEVRALGAVDVKVGILTFHVPVDRTEEVYI